MAKMGDKRGSVRILNSRYLAVIATGIAIVLILLGVYTRTVDSQRIRVLEIVVQPTHSNEKFHPQHELSDAELIELCQRKAFDFFWNEADPQTGLVKDRAGNFSSDTYTVSSVAATGFGLSALAIGVERGWITRRQGYARARTTLRFFRNKMDHQHGWFYHFVDVRTGERVWNSEVSSIDTALFLASALFLGEYFAGTEVSKLAEELYQRVDFQWMLTNGGAKPQEKLLSHGWTPEHGFLSYRWDTYSEHLILNLLALGSPTHPIPAECWDAWTRHKGQYAGYHTFTIGPLFTHQYSQAFVDFRGKRDRLGYDYWQSSINATLANRQFCIDSSNQFYTYNENVWGLSACDGPNGYRAYGAPPGRVEHDGTVAPWSAIASIVFTPGQSLAAMRHIYERFGERLWGRYGFCDAFNLDQDWWDQDVIGIDLGIALIMLENYRTELVWAHLMSVPHLQRAMIKAGF
jgi:hypothetical protein